MQFANIITLTTDFGLKDSYVGQVKGAILKSNISVRIIDICHSIPAHDILDAAVTIHSSYRYFPKGSVHMVIVDPGVGSQRNILVAVTKRQEHLFIAPDNGVLSLLFQNRDFKDIYRVENASLFPSEISSTFHARDIMAPIAAALAGGMPVESVGPSVQTTSCVRLELPEPVISNNRIEGQVLHIDRFGNIRTNITTADLSTFQPMDFGGIRLKGHHINTISNTYSDSPPGSLVALIDSSGYLEIAMNRGNAADFTKCKQGDSVLLIINP